MTEEVDRVYMDVPSELVIEDGGLGRRIRINSTGSKTAIVWNPWTETSQKMADLAADDYQRFICVETANAADDVVEVGAGSVYQLKAAVRGHKTAATRRIIQSLPQEVQTGLSCVNRRSVGRGTLKTGSNFESRGLLMLTSWVSV